MTKLICKAVDTKKILNTIYLFFNIDLFLYFGHSIINPHSMNIQHAQKITFFLPIDQIVMHYKERYCKRIDKLKRGQNIKPFAG